MGERRFGRAKSTTSEIYVVPVRRTAKWQVHDGDPRVPSSEHASETAAERAAYRRAEVRGVERVVVRDRYHRTRQIPVTHGARITS